MKLARLLIFGVFELLVPKRGSAGSATAPRQPSRPTPYTHETTRHLLALLSHAPSLDTYEYMQSRQMVRNEILSREWQR